MFRVATGTLFVILLLSTLASAQSTSASSTAIPTQYNGWTIAQMQAAMDSGRLSSAQLTQYYITRILDLDQSGPGVNSIIELNPDALAMARNADALRKKGFHSPMLGIPIVLKDNIDTGDKMQTSAGSFALVGQPALQDSTVAANLRAAGAVILGKANLSEWANFRSFESSSGWSGRGGQTNNPYGINRNPCGSSSGSGAATSSNFTAVALATETDGSVVCPASLNGVVGIKPTVGLTSRAGVVPISHTQDTVGVHGRTVADAATVLGVIQSRTYDGRDAATGGVPLGKEATLGDPTSGTRPPLPTDYTQFVNPNGLQGARIGVIRAGIDGAPQPIVDAYNAVIQQVQNAGATLVPLDDNNGFFDGGAGNGEFLVLCYDFKNDLNNYFGSRVGVPVANGTLETAIAFDAANADVEEPFFNDDIFTFCDGVNSTDPNAVQTDFGISYNDALALDRQLGINFDKVLSDNNLDAIMAPTDSPAWATDLLFGDHFLFASSYYAAEQGYPIVQVPAAMVFGMPMGISFIGTAFSEPELIKLASGFEAVNHTRADNPPTFPTFAPSTHIAGTSPFRTPRRSSPPTSKAPTHMIHPM